MFCPRCAAQNSDDTKFCRGCGTSLTAVSLALTDPEQLVQSIQKRTAKHWLVRRREGVSALIKGTGLIGASGFIGAALAAFSNLNDWIFVWLGLASWLAVWGIILWSQGINALVESRSLRQELALDSEEIGSRHTQELIGAELPTLASPHTDASATTKLATPSVTEHTTQLLNK